MSVDHCFSIKGQGTVMTGTILSGSISLGDSVEIPALKVSLPASFLLACLSGGYREGRSPCSPGPPPGAGPPALPRSVSSAALPGFQSRTRPESLSGAAVSGARASRHEPLSRQAPRARDTEALEGVAGSGPHAYS